MASRWSPQRPLEHRDADQRGSAKASPQRGSPFGAGRGVARCLTEVAIGVHCWSDPRAQSLRSAEAAAGPVISERLNGDPAGAGAAAVVGGVGRGNRDELRAAYAAELEDGAPSGERVSRLTVAVGGSSTGPPMTRHVGSVKVSSSVSDAGRVLPVPPGPDVDVKGLDQPCEAAGDEPDYSAACDGVARRPARRHRSAAPEPRPPSRPPRQAGSS
jgi:hypothetical protein